MIPLFSTEQIRKADEYAAGVLDIPGIVLMENAARSIYEITFRTFPWINSLDSIGIVTGKGNNAGDGFAAARHFANNNFRVEVLCIAKPGELRGDALKNYLILKKLSVKNDLISLKHYKTIKDIKIMSRCAVIFDAILGTGAQGEVREPIKSIIEELNELNSIKISIDIPSGLNANTGYGNTVFAADLTITLAEFKKGLFFNEGYRMSGEVIKGTIGSGSEYFDSLDVNSYLIEPEDALPGIPIKDLGANKYSSGKVLIVAGSGLFPGAAVLTSKAALNCSAGAVVLAFPRSIKEIAQIKLNEVVVRPYEDDYCEILTIYNLKDLQEKIEWADVIAIGPGLGRAKETSSAVIEMIRRYPGKRFVVDADGIWAFNKKYSRYNISNCVFTPHHKEFADLLGISLGGLKADLLTYGRKFVKKTGAHLVLKGAPTIIFTPNGDALINSAGNPGMAKFGTGDVLTGVISAYISCTENVEEAIISAVYIHSLSADLLSIQQTENCYNATDILNNIPNAVKFIEKSVL